MRHIVLSVFFLFGGIITVLNAQPCALADARRAPGVLGYQPRGDGSYCEGVIVNTNSAGVDLDIASFSKGPISFYPSSEEVITINSLVNTGKTFHVRGLNFNMRDRYRVDFDLAPGAAMAISAATVIARIPIPKEHFGVYGSQQQADKLVYLPVKVTSKQLPKSGTGSAYYLQLVKNVDFKAAEYRYIPYLNNKAGTTSDAVAIRPSDIKSERIALELPAAMNTGVYKIRVFYVLTNGYQSSKDFFVQLP